uniref:Neurotransmitter-gated ion-channel ligand-binding domain-containing protein n=2 Tax=Ciona intestinalis TaxID=7719 RepID=F6Z8J3_CIOIN
MKHLLIFVYCTLNVVLSNELMISKESQQFHSYSTKSSLKTKIGYKKCLSSVPSYVYATVKATESSLPHTFNVTVLGVKESYFEVELKRTDVSEGWNMFVTVDWKMYTGDFIVVNNKAIWLPDVFTVTDLNRENATMDCYKREGQLVEVADKRSFTMVYDYVRNKFQFGKQEFVDFWLGSSYNPRTSQVLQSNGE